MCGASAIKHLHHSQMQATTRKFQQYSEFTVHPSRSYSGVWHYWCKQPSASLRFCCVPGEFLWTWWAWMAPLVQPQFQSSFNQHSTVWHGNALSHASCRPHQQSLALQPCATFILIQVCCCRSLCHEMPTMRLVDMFSTALKPWNWQHTSSTWSPSHSVCKWSLWNHSVHLTAVLPLLFTQPIQIHMVHLFHIQLSWNDNSHFLQTLSPS